MSLRLNKQPIRNKQTRKQYAKNHLDGLISATARPLRNSRPQFLALMHVVRTKSQLLTPLNRGHNQPEILERIVSACRWMTGYRFLWHRQPEDWTAPDGGLFVQFRSLVSHLFDKFPVPHFMAPVWMSDGNQRWLIALYLHLADGQSIRQFRLPARFRLTRQAASWFMQAPADLCPMKALRWAQIRSLGGDDRLARLLLSVWPSATLLELRGSRFLRAENAPAPGLNPERPSRTILSGVTEDECFWESAIRFLIKNQPLSADEVIQIVQFLFQQREQPAEDVLGPGMGRQPIQPEFSLEGRTLMSLRRHMANWRTELGISLAGGASNSLRWEKTSILPFQFVSGEMLWTIDEILNGEDLKVEGGIMRHCVADYLKACVRRQTSIWSMKLTHGKRRQRLLTIEVNPETREIRQVKGKLNSPPSESGLDILHRWADREQLRCSCSESRE